MICNEFIGEKVVGGSWMVVGEEQRFSSRTTIH
jgi:hypothetical protein